MDAESTEPNAHRARRSFGWRFGALLSIAMVGAIVILGAKSDGRMGPIQLRAVELPQHILSFNPANNGDGAASGRVPLAPKIQTVPLGTEDDCNKRLAPDEDAQEYCSDMFLTLHDLEQYWTEQFPKLATKNQTYAAPLRFVVGLSPVPGADCLHNTPNAALNYCGDPAHYAYSGKNNEVYLAESAMLQYHKEGDFAASIVVAHEWGHHIQDLLGPLQQQGPNSYTIHFELQADCYAGAWANYEDKKLAELEKGDVDEASNILYSAGDSRQGSWNDENAHGFSEQRVLSFRTGYELGDPKLCAMWTTYDGDKQPLLNLGKYALAIAPPDVVSEEDFGYSVASGDNIKTVVVPLSKLGPGSAQTQFGDIFKMVFGTSGRPIDVYTPQDLPNRGKLPQSEVDKATSYAQTYELNIDGKQLYGIFYVSMRSGGGDGVVLADFSPGAAGKADFKPLQSELRYLLLGLSVKNGGSFAFGALSSSASSSQTSSSSALVGGSPDDLDTSGTPDLTTPEGDQLDPNVVLHDRRSGGSGG